MLFNKINFSEIVLNQYLQSWFIWIVFFIVGVILLKCAQYIGTTNKEIKKMESSGSGLISLSVIIHFGVIWALL